MAEFERIVKMTPAYDKRARGYGVHGVELHMVLKGPKGATQFVLYTNWYLPSVTSPIRAPLPADLGYHSPAPRWEDQPEAWGPCPYLAGEQPCFYDGSGLQAERVFGRLLREGDEGVWAELEAYYASRFEDDADDGAGQDEHETKGARD